MQPNSLAAEGLGSRGDDFALDANLCDGSVHVSPLRCGVGCFDLISILQYIDIVKPVLQ